MATYLNDLRLTELATGEGSGTWGTTTNLSLELIGEALGFATQQVFGSDADATTTIADGASDPARAMYFKITSAGSLTATRTCTIAPNTISRVMFIENATTGSQSIQISQGSGASVTILAGKTAVVYLDGAGSGAAVVDAMAGVDPGVTDTLTEVLVAGNTSGGTNIELSTTDKVQFRDAAIYLNDINGAVDMASTLAVTGAITGATAAFTQTNTVNSPVSARYDGSNKKVAFNINNSNGQAFIASNSNSVGSSGNQTYDITNTAGKIDFGSGITIDTAVSGSAGGTITYVNNADFLPTGIVFNEGGVDADFRVESSGNANMLFVDGGENAVGIGTIPPAWRAGLADVGFNVGVNAALYDQTGGSVFLVNNWYRADDNTLTYRNTNEAQYMSMEAGEFSFANAASGSAGAAITFTERMKIDASGGLITNPAAGGHAVFNEAGVDADFRVESDTNTHALFVQGSDGNVGIGTSSPVVRLNPVVSYVASTIIPAIKLATVGGYNSGSGAAIDFGQDQDTYPTWVTGRIASPRTGNNWGGSLTFSTNDNSAEAALVERMTLDASGNLEPGILSTTGAATFGGNVVGLTFESSVSSSSTNLATNSGGSLTLKNTSVTDGNFSNIGGYNSNTLVTSQINFVNVSQASRTGAITFNVHNGTSMPEVGRFDASGNFLVGTTSVFSGSGITPLMTVSKSAGSGIGVNLIGSSEVGLATRPSADHNYYAGFFLNNAGTGVGNITVGSSTTAYNTSSDERLKENITDANDAGNKIDAIKVRQYDWKADGSHQDYGMIAQELMTVAPEAVSAPEDPEQMMGVDYSKLVPMMLKEIQSLRARISQLEGAN
jgi:hypothetical protein